MAAGLSVFACLLGRAAAHEPPSGTGVYARGALLVVRTSRGLVLSRSAEWREFRFVCNEALGVAEFDAPSVLVREDASLLVGSSTGLWRVSSDLCAIEPVGALGATRVSELVFAPHDRTHVYAATDAGLFESRDEGESFVQLDVHAFDSLEVPESAPDYVFAAGKLSVAAGLSRAYFARWQAGRSLDLHEFALEPNEYGIALLGSDPRHIFAVAHAYLGTEYLDRFLVSTDGAHSWQSPLSTLGIAAFVSDAATGVGLLGSATGLWRTADAEGPLTQLRSEAVSCLALVSPRLYMCDGAGALGGMSESTDGGEHWRSLLRWNQVSGLAACPLDAPAVQACETAWDDWQRELPAGPPLTQVDAGTELADAGQHDAAVATAHSMLSAAVGCAAASGASLRTGKLAWLWLTFCLFSIRIRLRTKRFPHDKNTPPRRLQRGPGTAAHVSLRQRAQRFELRRVES